jgi:meiotic recombination protein SPO11
LTQLTATDYKTNALTYTERRKAASLLRIVGESVRLEAEELNLLRELQIMLMLSVKFEIQAVNGEGYMTSWLDERLSSEVV